jgi:DNA polymerase-1
VREFFGVSPAQVIDVLALMGDSVDNVPGVPGVGQVTAKKWISEYGTLAELLARAAEIKGKVGESLRANTDNATLSRRLVEIPTDLPIPLEPETLAAHEPDWKLLKDLFVEHEFHSLAAEVQGEAAAPPELSFRRLAAGEAWPSSERPVGVAVLFHRNKALLAATGGPGEVAIVEAPAAEAAARYLALDSAESAVAAGDAKPLDALLARNDDAIAGEVLDVGLMQYVLAPGVASSDLAVLAFQRLGEKVSSDKEAGVASGSTLPEAYAIDAADRWLAERADAARRLAPILRAELSARPALEKIYREIERPLTPVLARMEIAGVAIDAELLRTMSSSMESTLRDLETRIWAEAGEEFNVNSPVKLGQILFEKLKYPVGRKTAKTKASSTGVEVLTALAEQGFTLPKLVIEYREIAKLKGTYVDALPQLADAAGRVHTSFRQTVAATGRLSSSDPNLQNIPVRTAMGREIRRAFVAPPGRRLVVADYSQIELRLLAHLSGDENLIEAFAQQQDIHEATAAKIFGVVPDLISPEMRNAAKRINFALLYGMAPFTLGRELGVSTSEAKSYVDSYFARFPRVRETLDGILEGARSTREVTTLFGRVRPIPDIAASNAAIRGNAERMALNAPFQGSAADIIKIAMVRLDRELSSRGLRTRLLLQVHDELVLESPEEEVDAAGALVEDVMEKAAELKVRLAVDVGTGRNWLDAKAP